MYTVRDLGTARELGMVARGIVFCAADDSAADELAVGDLCWKVILAVGNEYAQEFVKMESDLQKNHPYRSDWECTP